MNKTLTEGTIGQRIKARRLALGMTQQEVANELFDVAKSTISQYESDKTDIKCSVMMELCKVLKTTPDYLLGFTNQEDQELVEAYHGIKSKEAKKLVLAQMKLAGENF